MADSSFTRSPASSTRRRIRVRADLSVVLAFGNGDKLPGRVIDVSTGGMSVRCQRVPSFGETVTVVVRLGDPADWHFIPGRVRWFGGQGFGLVFENLNARQSTALELFVRQSAA